MVDQIPISPPNISLKSDSIITLNTKFQTIYLFSSTNENNI